MTNAQTEARAIPEFIRPWTAPFHVTMDGIKDAKGCWICSAGNNKLAHQLVELMNYAATSATALAAKDAELAEVKAKLFQSRNFWSDELSAKNAALAEARKALEPFSRFAGPVFERDFNDTDTLTSIAAADGGYVVLTAGDFFAVRRAREQGEKP